MGAIRQHSLKGLIRLFGLSILVLVIVSTYLAISTPRRAAAAAEFATGDQVDVVNGPLNIREGPSLSARVAGDYLTGTTLEIRTGPISADGYTWYGVSVAGASRMSIGWVAGEFLGHIGGGDFASGDTVIVGTDALNVRTGPGLDNDVIDVLVQGEQCVVTNEPPAHNNGYTWYQVNTGAEGTLGWVAGGFIGFVGHSTEELASGSQVRITSSNVNWRVQPGLNSDIIATLDQGDIFSVEEGPVDADGYAWYRVSADTGGSGWIAADFLEEGGSNAVYLPGEVVQVDADALNLRIGPGLDQEVIDVLTTGGSYSVIDGPQLADGYTWYEVNTPLGTGWIAGEFVRSA